MGLVDDPDHLLTYLHAVCQAATVPIGWSFWSGGSSGVDCERHIPAFPGTVGGGDLRGSLRLGDGNPEGQHLLHRHCIWVTGDDSVLRTAGADNETTAFSNFQSAVFIAAYPKWLGSPLL